MSRLAVKKFEMVKDILIYIATARHEVTLRELQIAVTDLYRTQLNDCLLELVEQEYLISNKLNTKRAYTATLKTKQLFGIAP